MTRQPRQPRPQRSSYGIQHPGCSKDNLVNLDNLYTHYTGDIRVCGGELWGSQNRSSRSSRSSKRQAQSLRTTRPGTERLEKSSPGRLGTFGARHELNRGEVRHPIRPRTASFSAPRGRYLRRSRDERAGNSLVLAESPTALRGVRAPRSLEGGGFITPRRRVWSVETTSDPSDLLKARPGASSREGSGK